MKSINHFTPFFIPLLGAIVGIYGAASWNISPLITMLGAIIITPLIFIVRYRHKILLGSMFFAFFCIGALVLWFEKKDRDLILPLLQNKTVTLIGTIVDKDDWIQSTKHGEIRRRFLRRQASAEGPWRVTPGNRKQEIRNSKLETNSNDQNSENSCWQVLVIP